MRGFTLIELVLVIVIVGVVSVMTTQFIVFGVDIYRGSSEQQSRVAEARYLIERLSRELGLAHLSSVVTTAGGLCLEFVPVNAVGAYRGNILGENAFNAIATPEFQANGSINYVGQRLSVYTLANSDFYQADAALTSGSGTVALIDAYTDLGANAQVNIDLNGTRTLSALSPGQRYYILDTPIRYCLENNQMVRYADYGWVFSTGSSVLMLDNLTINTVDPTQGSYFDVSANNLFRVGVASLHLNLRLSEGEIRFHHRMSLGYVP